MMDAVRDYTALYPRKLPSSFLWSYLNLPKLYLEKLVRHRNTEKLPVKLLA